MLWMGVALETIAKYIMNATKEDKGDAFYIPTHACVHIKLSLTLQTKKLGIHQQLRPVL